MDKEEISKICFSDNGYEEKEVEIESVLADRFLLIAAAKGVYDWTVLHDILGDARFLSEAKVKTYEKHRDDLRKVKQLLRMVKKFTRLFLVCLRKMRQIIVLILAWQRKMEKNSRLRKNVHRKIFINS